jgi:transposase
MARLQKEPLRPLTQDDRSVLEPLARATSERADTVARAKALLAVAQGAPFTEAARAAGRRAGDAVAKLVARFNQEGLAALLPRHGGGPPIRYGPKEQERILTEFRRPPDRERDGTATWSLTTLQRALRTAPDGLPNVSTWTIFQTLHRAGYSGQESRTWCETGTVVRQRKAGKVTVTDPDTARKRG